MAEWKKHDGYAIKAGADMYLYNGVELPDINTVWASKPKYKYATIFATSGLNIEVFFSNNPYDSESTIAMPYCFSYLRGNAWSNPESSNGTRFIDMNEAVWASYDILNADGSIYLSSSDPVPATEWLKGNYYTVQGGKWVKQDAVGTVAESE